MAFGKMTPEELKEMFGGMDPKDIKARLDKLADLETKMTTIAETSKNTDETVASVKALLTAIQEKNTTDTNTNTNTNTNNNGELPKWSEDADAAFNARVSPLTALAMESRADIVYNRVARKYKDWGLLEQGIQEYMAKASPVQRASDEFVDNVYWLVKGKNADKIAEHNREKKGDFYVEPARSNTQDVKTPEESLTDDERAQAAKFGMSPKDYAESKKTMKVF